MLPINDSDLCHRTVHVLAHPGGDPVGETPGTREDAEKHQDGAGVKGGEERKRRGGGLGSVDTLIQDEGDTERRHYEGRGAEEADVNQGVATLPLKTHLPPTDQDTGGVFPHKL